MWDFCIRQFGTDGTQGDGVADAEALLLLLFMGDSECCEGLRLCRLLAIPVIGGYKRRHCWACTEMVDCQN